MTHDELLDLTMSDAMLAIRKALRAAVELHKPYANPINCRYCNTPYPCDEIQAIEKELK